ncbi:LysM peptidoglycan-binding domain-containing protein [Rufibacter immobilis]|uniref:LysM peptidoglycan-binding domain-containing protein n=1 Tax=Rufibacter immobilis TaxID=1348778 RepID=A0A3M9MVR1_9BACT|nr:LysM peptidoglycan-binding domain-containing protein [Rufibacter immobilis]RNI29614.1 LysM peptidoglycan-binding domain-containing protein [Rufibacter immobilis]
MGLFDFLKKGEEKPVQKPVAQPAVKAPVAAQPAPAAAPQQPAYDTYTVKSGDSLSKIAKNFYGDAQQWHKIHQANLDKIKDPNLIDVGWQLKIPKA